MSYSDKFSNHVCSYSHLRHVVRAPRRAVNKNTVLPFSPWKLALQSVDFDSCVWGGQWCSGLQLLRGGDGNITFIFIAQRETHTMVKCRLYPEQTDTTLALCSDCHGPQMWFGGFVLFAIGCFSYDYILGFSCYCFFCNLVSVCE